MGHLATVIFFRSPEADTLNECFLFITLIKASEFDC